MDVVETAVGRALVAHARVTGVSLPELGAQLGLDPAAMAALLSGERPVDLPLAHVLAGSLGGTAEEWLSQDDRAPRVARWLAALDDFGAPSLRALRERGHVSATKQRPGLLADELEAYFDCEPDECSALLSASFRQSDSFTVHKDAVDVWLRLAEAQASFVAERDNVPELDREELAALLVDLAAVADEDPAEYLPTVRERLADVGVVLVVQPDVPGTRLSGASWTARAGNGVVALTLRHGTDDFFWWTLYHECAHLVLAHGVVVDLSGSDSGSVDEEEAADGLARARLAPSVWDAPGRKPTEQELLTEARRLLVPVGVLVGQWQKRELVEHREMRALKKSMPEPNDLEVHPGLDRRLSAADGAVAELLQAARAS